MKYAKELENSLICPECGAKTYPRSDNICDLCGSEYLLYTPLNAVERLFLTHSKLIRDAYKAGYEQGQHDRDFNSELENWMQNYQRG